MAEFHSLLPADAMTLMFEKHDIRKQLLLFDKILMFHDFEKYKEVEYEMLTIAQLAGENNLLYMKNFYRDMQTLFEKGKALKLDINLHDLSNDKDAQIFMDEYLTYSSIDSPTEDQLFNMPLEEFQASVIAGLLKDSLHTRIAAAYANKKNVNNRIVPVVSTILTGNNSLEPKSDMLLITLKKIPIIHERVPIDEVIGYKNSDGHQLNYLKFINWLNTLNKKDFDKNEFEDHLDYLLLDYKDNLNKHKLEYRYSTMRTVVNCTMGFIENIFKFKFTDAFNTFFEIKKAKIEMLKGEKDLKGNEVAYIVESVGDFAL